MLTSDFDYHLPDDRIARYPAPRGTSRLFCPALEGAARHGTVADLPERLRPGDLLVLNDTRVLPARLFARRQPGGGRLELLLARKAGTSSWWCLARPGRRARPGTRLRLAPDLEAEVDERGPDGLYRVTFSQPIEPRLEELGHVPLPPYIKRPDEPADRRAYQTVYARVPGSIAAPTAGLHFSSELLDRLRERGVGIAELTLHVGIGTFKPVTAELVHEHVMDGESYDIPPATAAAIAETRSAGGRIVAVGTTVVRALESAAREAGGTPRPGPGLAEIFIVPGHAFRVVDLLLTNFHLPRSTLLMLVSAFAGRERVLAAYREAIAAGYRFYSYGDAMLVRAAVSGRTSAGS